MEIKYDTSANGWEGLRKKIMKCYHEERFFVVFFVAVSIIWN